MKSGSTGYFKINLDVDLSVVNEIIFSLKSFAGLVQKTYPGEVEYDGTFLVPLNQADTALLQGYVDIEAQINLVDNGVVKSAVLTRYIDSTLATKFLDENTPALIEEVNMDVEAINIVRVGGGDTPVNAYTKAETDALFAKKTDIPDVSGLASREYVDGKIAEIPSADLSDYYTKSETDEHITSFVKDYLENNPVISKPAVIPKVFFNGDITGMSKDVSKVLKIEYKDGVNDFTAFADMKWQGNSSLSYPKKNFTIKLYEDETKTAKKSIDLGYGKQTKYCLKANWIDHTHARNIVTARLWGDVVASRANQSEIPTEMLNAPNYGAINGYPFKLYLNGVYQGLYTWNIPKDGWMFNMDKNNPDHCVLCAEGNNDGNMSKVYSTQFRRTTNFAEDTDGEWTIEFPDVVSDDVKTSFNNLLNFVATSTDEDFKANLGNYANVQSLIDYYIFCYLDCGLDGLAQNMIMATYDGTHWFASMYDLDSTWGLWWNGTKFVASTYRCPEDYQENNSLLWQRMETLFVDELKARYTELRNGALSVTNIITRFEAFTDEISNDLYEEDGLVYSGIPNRANNNIRQIRQYVVDRCAYVDGEFASMGEVATLTSITATKTKTTYTVGENYSTDDITVTASYSDGTSRNVTEFSIDGDVSTDSEGATIITISYTEGEITKTADITITVVASGSEPSEPTDVTLIEALNLGGTKYVNTEYVPNYTSKVECLFDSVWGAWGTIFGSDNFLKYQWRQSASSGMTSAIKGTPRTTAVNLSSEINDATAITDVFNKSVSFIMGTININYTGVDGGQADTTFPLLIGAGWYQNAIEKPSGIHTIKEIKVYENDVLIKDFKPATKNGVEGMYDTISGTFYPAVTYEA